MYVSMLLGFSPVPARVLWCACHSDAHCREDVKVVLGVLCQGSGVCCAAGAHVAITAAVPSHLIVWWSVAMRGACGLCSLSRALEVARVRACVINNDAALQGVVLAPN